MLVYTHITNLQAKNTFSVTFPESSSYCFEVTRRAAQAQGENVLPGKTCHVCNLLYISECAGICMLVQRQALRFLLFPVVMLR